LSYKDIIVYLDAGPFLEMRLDVALKTAAKHKARLVGIDISTEAARQSELAERVRSLQETFETQARQHRVDFQFRVAASEDASNLYVHSVDLFIATQPHVDSAHLALGAVPEQTLLTGGVPGLILPCLWQQRELGKNVTVAWNASREATRALHDALPILQQAEKVILFAFERHYDAKKTDMDSVVAHLAHHGVKARVEAWPDTGEMEPVSALFASLDAEDVDLIVAGAYGHSRWIEGLFGGVSRDLLRQETMAVFLSH
jgi:nucleotide-binding universal stress UspA family protein